MAEPVAYIRSARSPTTADVYILRPPGNVVGKTRPNISQIKSRNGFIGAIFHDPGLLYIGDEVVAGEDTSVEIEFFIGGRHHFSNGGSGQIRGERDVVQTGLTKAKSIKEGGMFLAWHVAAWGIGAAARAVSAGGIYVKGGLEIYKSIPKVDLHLVKFYAGEAPNIGLFVSGLMHGAKASPLPAGAPSTNFGPAGIRG